MKRVAWFPAVALAVMIALTVATSPLMLVDLPPMYCAGYALTHGGDPYLLEPTSRCQLAIGHLAGGMPLPSPLPPFVLAFFAPLSLLPFVAVAVLYAFTALGAFGLTVYWLQRCTRAPWWAIALVLVWHEVLFALAAGDLSVYAIAAIAGAAYAWRAGKGVACGLAAFAALIQTTLGLPLVAVVALAGPPRARVALVACACAAALVSLLLGPGLSLEYVRAELPLQAFAEVDNWFQFSLTSLVASVFATPPDVALRAGAASYAAMFCVATACGVELARRGHVAAAALISAALVTVGGTYLHVQQLAAALPAGIFLAARARGRLRTVAAFATALSGGEWLSSWKFSGLAALGAAAPRAIGSGIAMSGLLALHPRRAFAFASAAFALACLAYVGVYQSRLPQPHPTGTPPQFANAASPVAGSGAYLSGALRAHNERFFAAAATERIDAFKLLLWLGTLGIAGCAVVATLRPESLRPESEEPAP